VQRVDPVGSGRREAVLQRLEVTPQVRQRGAQLVRHVGDHRAARALVGVEGGGEIVERARQAPQLVAPRDGGGRRPLALCQAPHAFRQLRERADEPPGQ
jgi:hypothetical protein